VKERPILFQGAMVRAILDGTKTQTRRVSGLDVINAAPERFTYLGVITGPGEPHYAFHDNATGSQTLVRCRSGLHGDRLWVREAWAYTDCIGLSGGVLYRADFGEGPRTIKYRPSIHMPRHASRITLEVTGVRVERLQDISEDDAQAEGADCLIWSGIEGGAADLIDWPLKEVGHPYRNGYAVLWESINGEGSWAANPWVWAVEFRRLP
jgi:hypothetical protein